MEPLQSDDAFHGAMVDDGKPTPPSDTKAMDTSTTSPPTIQDDDLYWPIENALRDFPFDQFLKEQKGLLDKIVPPAASTHDRRANELRRRGCIVVQYVATWTPDNKICWPTLGNKSNMAWKPIRQIKQEVQDAPNKHIWASMDVKVLETYNAETEVPLWIALGVGPASKEDKRGFQTKSRLFLLRRRTHEPQHLWINKLDACMYYCPWCYVHDPTGPGNPSPSDKINKQQRPLELCPDCKIVWYCGDEHRRLDAARHATDCKDRSHMVARIRREFTHVQLLCKPVLHFFRPLAANEPSYVLPARKAPASSQSSKDDMDKS